MRAALATLAIGCVASEPLPLPPEASREGSALFATKDEAVRIFAYDLGQPAPLSIGDGDLYLLLYADKLEALGLARGEQPRPNPDVAASARPFPPGFTAYRAGADRSWTGLTAQEIETVFGRRVLPAPAECEPIGCDVRDEASAFEYCERPCAVTTPPEPPEAPEPPARPAFGPCPPGWDARTSAVGGLAFCEPPALLSCSTGQAQLLGDAGCAPIATACDGDGFPASSPSGAIFVRSGSAGDGSRASPFGSIGQALSASSDGTTIAIGSGAYAESITADRSVAILGCSGTTIAGDVTIAAGASVSITDVSIQPAADGVDVRGSATLARVEIAGGRRGAVVFGTLDATSLAVRGASEGGIVVEGSGARATLGRAVVSDATRYGVFVRGGTLSLTDVVVQGSRAFGTDPLYRGYGVLAQEASVTAERALFERNSGNDLAFAAGTATLRSIVSRDSGELAIDLALAATADIGRVVVLDPRVGALWFNGASGRAEDVYVSGSGMRAASAVFGGDMAIDRIHVEASTSRGISVEGASASIRDLTILAIDGDAVVVQGGELDLERAVIDLPRRDAIGVYDQMDRESLAVLCDISVAGDPESSSYALYGVDKTRIEATRFSSNQRPIVIRSFEDHLLRDISVKGAYGVGVSVRDGSYDVDRMFVDAVSGVGIQIDGGFFGAKNVTVENTKRTAPDSDTTGIGIRVFGDQSLMAIRLGHLGIERFLLRANQEIGIGLDFSSTALIDDGEIAGSKVGFEVNRQQGFDPEETLRRVIYRNNTTNVVFDRAER